jgi:hypothetical protein
MKHGEKDTKQRTLKEKVAAKKPEQGRRKRKGRRERTGLWEYVEQKKRKKPELRAPCVNPSGHYD